MKQELLDSFTQFKVTFTDPSQKYNQVTRTVNIWAKDESHAEGIVIAQYDSFRARKKMLLPLPTGQHVKILKVEEVKDVE